MALAASAENAGKTKPMPAAATKKHAHSQGAVVASAPQAKPTADTLAPTRIIFSGGHSSWRSTTWARISATPTVVRAMPAT
ncbi:hypothetical protein D3C76_1536700 [compost metagenome]